MSGTPDLVRQRKRAKSLAQGVWLFFPILAAGDRWVLSSTGRLLSKKLDND
jgi:hypothetical protein